VLIGPASQAAHQPLASPIGRSGMALEAPAFSMTGLLRYPGSEDESQYAVYFGTGLDDPSRSFIAGTAQPLRPRPPALVRESALDRTARRPRRPPWRRRRCQRTGENLGEPLHRGFSVLNLRAMLGRLDREHPVDESPPETLLHARALDGSECGRPADIQAELDAGVGGVHRLPAGSRGATEPPRQLAFRNQDGPGYPQRTRHDPSIACPPVTLSTRDWVMRGPSNVPRSGGAGGYATATAGGGVVGAPRG